MEPFLPDHFFDFDSLLDFLNAVTGAADLAVSLVSA
jgi:hypothetical protein